MESDRKMRVTQRKPSWLRKKFPRGPEYEIIRSLLKEKHLHTVCEEAKCPNIWQCFSRKTATFLIMGSICTRNCRFCAITNGKPDIPDPGEPARVAEAALKMDLHYVVVTSVTRDDLPDGGASCFAYTIGEIREKMPDTLVEVLIPDFLGDSDALRAIVNARPDVVNHNLETVPRLYQSVRPEASYERSLEVLKLVGKFDPSIPTKSGIMLGLGETGEEIRNTLGDILDTGCRIVTLGQYLQPSPDHLPVERFVHPDEFDKWCDSALEMGFSAATSGPFVRSSYHARELYDTI
jgi:lipoic acid synthetase